MGRLLKSIRWRTWLGAVADWLYPGACACCGELCDGGRPICLDCFAQLKHLESAAACRACGKPLSQDGAPCPWCHGKGLYPYDSIVRLGVFVEPLRHLIHQTKYAGRWPVGEFLADRLLRQSRVRAMLKGADCVVPVPLHWLRQFIRRYNQAEVVARRLRSYRSRALKLAQPVRRIRNTESQTRLSRQQREENLRGAFKLIRPRAIAGKHVVVIDDVMTTGATLQAVGRALVAAKPASLSAIVVSLADPRHANFEAI